MTSMIDSAVAKGSRVMFICERRVLVEQFSKHLDFIGIDHGILMAKHWRFRPHDLVQIATAQTLEKMDSWPAFDVVFVDEIHACMRLSITKMLDSRPGLKVVGATATPFHKALPKYFSNIVNVITMRELVDGGFLVPFRVFAAREIDTAGVKVVAGEWQKDELETRGRQIVGDIVADYIRLSNEVFGGYRKTICFSCGVAHGTELAQKFGEAGINAVQISYKDTEEYKADVLADFAKADTDIKIVISSDILTRGFDQPDVEHVILARPLKKSFSSHVQMAGRGARPFLGKDFCVVQDHAGNWLRFLDSWNELYGSGVTELSAEPDSKSRKEPTEKEKNAAKCPRCSALWAGRSDTCLHCGYRRPVINRVESIPGQMIELSVAKPDKYSSEYKRDWYQGMIAHLRAIGKNENRAYHLYQEKFKINPVWEKKSGSQASPAAIDAIGYLTRANIAFAKGRRAA